MSLKSPQRLIRVAYGCALQGIERAVLLKEPLCESALVIDALILAAKAGQFQVVESLRTEGVSSAGLVDLSHVIEEDLTRLVKQMLDCLEPPRSGRRPH